MDPNKGRRTVSPKSGVNYGTAPGASQPTSKIGQGYGVVQGAGQPSSQIGPGASSLTILSSILRSPHPNLQKGTSKPQDPTVALTQLSMPKSRGLSPVRVITTTINQGASNVSSKPGGLSPSRVPTTLPPKKSHSPSRTFCTEGQSPSPKQRIVIPARNVSPASTADSQLAQGQGRPVQALLSHLPYLQQTLQGAQPERIFQPFKARKEQQQGAVSSQMVQKVMERKSPTPSQNLPTPAHQRTARSPPHHVSTIRRTPSPAHMQIGADTKAKVLVEHLSSSQAMNLVKTSEAIAKVTQESKWSDADFKYGDLLKSINKSHDAIQAPLLQRGLSPITPADPADNKPWISNIHHPAITLHSNMSKPQFSQSFTTSLASSLSNLTSSVQTVQHPTSAASFAPVSVTIPSVGFTPVVLPSQSQKLSPKGQVRQNMSPKSRATVAGSGLSLPVNSASAQKPVVSYVHAPVPSTGIHSEVKVFPGRDFHRYAATSLDTSVTEAGPPNITISSCSSIIPQEKAIASQKLPKNPFTFPATPPVSLTNEKPLGRAVTHTTQSKLTEVESMIKERHVSGEMPCLYPVSPVSKEKKMQIKEEPGDTDVIEIPQPLNMRLQTLANLPNNPTYRPVYRATSVAIHKAKVACTTNSAKSLDILRQNLQKAINKELDTVIQSYMNKYFKLGIENIKLNNGESSITEDHIQAVCRQILEEAKKMYITDTGLRVSVSPGRDFSDNISETGSSGRRSALGRRRHPSDTDSEKSIRPGNKKKKGRFTVGLTGRSTPSKLSQQQCKREGPKFDPERLTEETFFVMGSKANKAMGFGATRGRLYMKHPDLFKYGGDQDDKTWLYEHQHMPATGGKSYLIVLEDIQELVQSDEYRDAPGINISVLNGFTVPMWMIEKMRLQMVAMRTDLPKQPRYRSRSATPSEPSLLTEVEDGHSPPKDLPFSSFSSPKHKVLETSPATDLEFLAAGGEPDDAASPFNMTGGFDDGTSQSDLDTLEDHHTYAISKH